MTMRVGGNFGAPGAPQSSGNWDCGFVVSCRNGPGLDWGIDNTAPGILGPVFIQQNWLFTTQTMNWWPPQFLQILDTGSVVADFVWIMNQQNADNLIQQIVMIKTDR